MHDQKGGASDSKITKKEISRALTGDSKTMIDIAMKIAKLLSKVDVSKTQVRNVFGSLKSIQMSGFNMDKFVLLKPRMHYITSRNKKLDPLGRVVSYSVDIISDSENKEDLFERFCYFFEAILAYHRALQKEIDFE